MIRLETRKRPSSTLLLHNLTRSISPCRKPPSNAEPVQMVKCERFVKQDRLRLCPSQAMQTLSRRRQKPSMRQQQRLTKKKRLFALIQAVLE